MSAVAAMGLALLAALPAQAAPAATDATAPAAVSPKRPKICLVLSGGGARGAAHVGVIKVLEEYRVPIHCIAGTSMGALVGAAFASGMSVEEMSAVNASISTELLFKDKPPRKEESNRKKQDDFNIFVGPEVGVGSKSLLPKGVVTGIQLETVLRKLSKAKGFRNFDELPIPFRAVATDLVTGKAVVFSEGELANVMRASMSVPGAIAPAEFGGMMLVDGMLTSNLPVDAARAMGADIVIAVNVGTPLLRREQITDIFGVTGQMLSILTEQNVQASLASLKPTDVLISPDLKDFSTGNFNDLPQIEPLGEVAARAMSARLAQLSIPPAEYAALRQRQVATAEPPAPVIDEIRFENLTRVNPETARAVMQTEVGKPLDQATIDADMRRLFGTDDFEHVSYRLLEEPNRQVLAVDAVEKSWGPDYVRFGLGLTSDFSGDAYFNLLASYRRTWLNSLGAEWRTDVQVGRTSRLATEFYQPLNAQGVFFVAPNTAIERRTTTLYQGNNRIASYDLVSKDAGVDLGAQFGRYGELRLGIQAGSIKPTLDTGPESLSPGQGTINQPAFTMRLVIDQIDSVNFPRSGYRLLGNIFNPSSQLGSNEPYAKWDTIGVAAYSMGEHTLNLAFKVGGKIGSDPLPRYDLFQWGGFLEQSGYRTGQLVGEKLEFGRLMYYHRISHGSILEGAYGGVSLERGRVSDPLVPGNPDGWLTSGSIFVGADSPLGPAFLGYGRTKDGDSSFYFFLGNPF
jgi:NTE family protein